MDLIVLKRRTEETSAFFLRVPAQIWCSPEEPPCMFNESVGATNGQAEVDCNYQ